MGDLMGQQQPPRPRREVAVEAKAVMDLLHGQYAQVIGQVMQENAEVTAMFEAVVAERDALRARLSALEGGAGVQTVPLPKPDPA